MKTNSLHAPAGWAPEPGESITGRYRGHLYQGEYLSNGMRGSVAFARIMADHVRLDGPCSRWFPISPRIRHVVDVLPLSFSQEVDL